MWTELQQVPKACWVSKGLKHHVWVLRYGKTKISLKANTWHQDDFSSHVLSEISPGSRKEE